MRAIINWISQAAVITWVSLTTVPQRLVSSITAVVGIAGVVTVFVGVLSIAEGFRAAFLAGGSPDVAIVLRAGSDAEMTSILARDDVRIIQDAPGILRASPELFVMVPLPKRSTGSEANVPLRGIGPAAYDVRKHLRMLAGRRFTPGRNEMVVGQGAALEFAGLDLNAKISIGPNEWTVVGIFTTDGTVSDSELWADSKLIQDLYRRGTSYQAVVTKLESPDAFVKFKDTLNADPRLSIKAMRETDYYADQASMVHSLVTGVGMVVATLMGIGAIFGALNTMYTAVSARIREIATLRALGFGGGPVVVSVVVESLVLAMIGGVIGGAFAYFVFNGFHTSTINWRSFSQVTFAFAVTPRLLMQGIAYALLMGTIGGLLPAIRAARVPVTAALRAL